MTRPSRSRSGIRTRAGRGNRGRNENEHFDFVKSRWNHPRLCRDLLWTARVVAVDCLWRGTWFSVSAMSYADGLGLILDPTRKKVTDDPGVLSPVAISAFVADTTQGAGSCVMTWNTSVAATAQVRFGVAPNMDQVFPVFDDTGGLSTGHRVVLNGLASGKVYLFKAISRQGGGKDGMNRNVTDGYEVGISGQFVTA